MTHPASYALERRRGWREALGSPPRAPDDHWDERRAESLRMTKPQPGDDGVRLEVSGGGYDVVDAGGLRALAGVQWARDGRLLVATAGGRLEARGARSWFEADDVVADLAAARPDPAEAPPHARSWL